ncbi:MAG: hypothetical protein R3D66_02225 [Alphaproteobacteria bacterium]
MAGYHFIFNLNDHTYESREQGLSDPEGYILSVHRYTPKFTALALSLNDSYDEIIMADNGYYARIRDLTSRYAKESAALLKRVSAFEKSWGEKPVTKSCLRRLWETIRHWPNGYAQAFMRLKKRMNSPSKISCKSKP